MELQESFTSTEVSVHKVDIPWKSDTAKTTANPEEVKPTLFSLYTLFQNSFTENLNVNVQNILTNSYHIKAYLNLAKTHLDDPQNF